MTRGTRLHVVLVADLVLLHELVRELGAGLAGRRLPAEVRDLIERPKVRAWVAMAVEAPAHAQRLRLRDDVHLVDTPVARHAAHAAVHVRRGVSCVECHGKVNEMPVVSHDQPHSMSWCLDCHRNPAARIREPADVFNLNSARLADQGPEGQKKAQEYIHNWKVMPPTSCSGCHR